MVVLCHDRHRCSVVRGGIEVCDTQNGRGCLDSRRALRAELHIFSGLEFETAFQQKVQTWLQYAERSSVTVAV